jgi:hypothetical protein
MRRLIALTTVVAALVGATSATAERPNAYEQGQKLCERQGGSFVIPDISSYSCTKGGAGFTTRHLSQAERLCFRNGGVTFNGGQFEYRCNFS